MVSALQHDSATWQIANEMNDLTWDDKWDMLSYLISSNSIVGRIFGSPATILRMAVTGKFPMGNMIDLLAEDEKARKFVLMCLNEALAAESQNLKNSYIYNPGDQARINPIEDAVDDCINMMSKKEQKKVMAILNDPVLRADYLGADSTANGAKYIINLMVEKGYPVEPIGK